jgi:hypothetical protein
MSDDSVLCAMCGKSEHKDTPCPRCPFCGSFSHPEKGGWIFGTCPRILRGKLPGTKRFYGVTHNRMLPNYPSFKKG